MDNASGYPSYANRGCADLCSDPSFKLCRALEILEFIECASPEINIVNKVGLWRRVNEKKGQLREVGLLKLEAM